MSERAIRRFLREPYCEDQEHGGAMDAVCSFYEMLSRSSIRTDMLSPEALTVFSGLRSAASRSLFGACDVMVPEEGGRVGDDRPDVLLSASLIDGALCFFWEPDGGTLPHWDRSFYKTQAGRILVTIEGFEKILPGAAIRNDAKISADDERMARAHLMNAAVRLFHDLRTIISYGCTVTTGTAPAVNVTDENRQQVEWSLADTLEHGFAPGSAAAPPPAPAWH
jgi:hypothetical protein